MITNKTSDDKIIKVKRGASGLGIFALKNINNGACIAEYTGKLVSIKEETKGKYLFQINSRWILDGKGRENIARYFNHSCKPNCQPKISKKRIFIYAIRNISEGEELNYNYGNEYFAFHIKPKGCKCSHCLQKNHNTAKNR